jgi:hypothetical protein
MIIVKGRNTTAAQAWRVYHKDSNASPASGVLNLNTNGAFVSSSTQWNNTAPTSSVFSVGTDPAVNENTKNYIAYCFNSVAGYSSIGSFTGNGSSTGPTVTTGFPVAFVMVKRTDSTGNWVMYDNTRATFNPINKLLYANLTSVEATWGSGGVDFNATGFQVKNSGGDMNVNGGTFIYMAFADTREAAFWKDVSGNNNNWTPNNLDYRDSLIDSPANNFAVMNPLTGEGTAQEGNLKVAANDNRGFYSSFAMESGKWYWEAVMVSGQPLIGVIATELHVPNSVPNSSGQHTIFYYFDGRVFQNGALLSTEASFVAGDIIGVTYDANTYEIKLYKNNSFQRTITANNQYTYAPACTAGSVSAFWTFNFGQDSTFSGARPAGGNQDDNGIGDFAYAPPSGYLALCTANLPTPTIVDGSEHFNTVLYTGNGSTKVINDVGLQADFIWIKQRNGSYHHALYDVLRGFTSSDNLASDDTAAEGYWGAVGSNITSINSSGYTLGNGSDINSNNDTFVAWNWKAGGTAVSNTAGSITSQVSANVDAGFSIVSYTGTGANATVGHSLGVQPSMIIAKRRDTAENWPVYTAFTGSSQYAYLDHTQAFGAATSVWQGVDPTSSVFSIGTSLTVNSSGGTYIAYCFANTEGYSKAGSYTGNGSTDGVFVFTGGRVQWLMVKGSSAAEGWTIWDNKRNAYNTASNFLYANTSNSELSTAEVDFVSNGFKLRNASSQGNVSGRTYIYLAIMESPLKHSNAR